MPENENELCPECQQPCVLVRWNNPGGIKSPPNWVKTLVCRRCVRVKHFEVAGAVLPLTWHPIKASTECVVCGRKYRDHPYYSDRHECPPAVERGRAAVDAADTGIERQQAFDERLADGFRMLADRSIDPS